MVHHDAMSLFDWEPGMKDMMPHVVVHYQHVYDKIKETWGTKECAEFLLELIEFSPEDGRWDRAGFSWEAMHELQNVFQVHLDKYPEFSREYKLRNDWNAGR